MKNRIFGILFPTFALLSWALPASVCEFDFAIAPVVTAALISGGVSLVGGFLGKKKKVKRNPFIVETEKQLFDDIQKFRNQGGFFSEGERAALRSRDLESVEGFFRPTEQNAGDLINAQGLTGTSAGTGILQNIARLRRSAQADVGGTISRQALEERMGIIRLMQSFAGKPDVNLGIQGVNNQSRADNAALFANLFAGTLPRRQTT